MESEKVKEIKKALEDNKTDHLPYIDGWKCKFVEYADILTLINELESENERLRKCREVDYKTMTALRQANTELNECMDEMQDRIAELESENKELRVVTDIANEREYRKKFNDEWRREYQKELDKQGNGHIAGHPDFDLVYKLYFEQKDRIAELESENKRLNKAINSVQKGFDNGEFISKDCKIRTLKQFVEKAKERCHNYYPSIDHYCCSEKAVNVKDIDELLKEYEK